MLDTDFPFGANAPDDEVTAVVIDSDSLTWRDIERVRREARADVATVAEGLWGKALGKLSRLRNPSLARWGSQWVSYCLTAGPRPVRHVGEAGKACRALELELASLGIVDPEGFTYGAEERAPRKRKFRGVFRGVAGQLADDRKRLKRGGWHG